MYITVCNRSRTAQYNTTFECNECVHCNRCRDAGYKTNCTFYDYIRPKFRVSHQVPYFTTGQPRLIYINLDYNDSLEKAQNLIERVKCKLTARQK